LGALDAPFVVAADGGAATALAFGYQPHVAIGDFDSLSEASQAELRRLAVPIEVFSRDKDMTDGQLALQRALDAKPEQLLLVGFLGGPRLDQTVANLLLLLRADVPTTMVDAHNEATLARPGSPLSWSAEAGEIVSLVPLGGPAAGVSTHGLRWPLNDELLTLGDTRGISNEPNLGESVSVSIRGGTLLVTRYFLDG
jgi:thiamine pyrophosphokinase